MCHSLKRVIPSQNLAHHRPKKRVYLLGPPGTGKIICLLKVYSLCFSIIHSNVSSSGGVLMKHEIRVCSQKCLPYVSGLVLDKFKHSVKKKPHVFDPNHSFRPMMTKIGDKVISI